MTEVVCAIIVRCGKFLIARKGAKASHPFCWEFPGGKIEEGENYSNAVVREIMEELDIQVRPDKILAAASDGVITLIPFICTIESGTPVCREHVELRWIEIKELDRYKMPGADLKLLKNRNNLEILKKYIGEQVNNTR